MFDSYSAYRLYIRLALYLFVCFFVGWILGETAWTMFTGSVVLILWHYRQLTRLNYWLWRDKRLTPPQGRGSWEGTFNGIYRLQGKNRRKIGQLARLLGRFRQGAEALPDAAVVLDSEYNIVWCNKLAQLLLGFVWPQDNGQRIDNLIRHPDFSAYLKSTEYTEPLELASPVSEMHILEIRLMPYGNSQMLLVARDITRIRQLEGMRKDFVANVSHELKTPLTVLQGYLEMMRSIEEDEVKSKPLMLMQQQTARMQSMVEQLLVLSRIEDATDVDLENTINMKKMMDLLKEEANALGLGKYQFFFSCEPNLNAHGNELQLRSACSNLISNAIRYTEEGGHITVLWRSTPSGGGLFSVKDTGEGIESQHIPRLTERFYRVDSARSRQTGGSGLGLAIVKHALGHHHSELTVTSELGKGSTFSFIIPVHLMDKQEDTVKECTLPFV